MMIPVGTHLFPFRTEKLNQPGPKIFKRVFEKIGRRRGNAHKLKLEIFPQNQQKNIVILSIFNYNHVTKVFS